MAISYSVKKILLYSKKLEVNESTIETQPPIPEGYLLVAITDDKGWVSAWDATEPSVDYFGFAMGVKNRFWSKAELYLLPIDRAGECLTTDEDKVSLEMLVAFIQSPEFLERSLDSNRN